MRFYKFKNSSFKKPKIVELLALPLPLISYSTPQPCLESPPIIIGISRAAHCPYGGLSLTLSHTGSEKSPHKGMGENRPVTGQDQ